MTLNLQHLRLGYLLMASPLPNTFVGGLMVTDYRGLPLSFFYTEPIQPNPIQQLLYGQVLSRYIKQEVILDSLLSNLSASAGEELHGLLISDDQLLGVTLPAQSKSKWKALPPIIRVSEPNTAQRLGEAGAVVLQSPTECLLQATAESNPIRLQWAPLPESGDMLALPALSGKAPSDEAMPAVISEVLVPVSAHMDLVEPLRRVEKALESICHEAGLKS